MQSSKTAVSESRSAGGYEVTAVYRTDGEEGGGDSKTQEEL